mmetsp:Transcript_24210/g.81630  ORF Transcript_24210/g.81630 Transcript_24210/m.81630 type:complete len:324 (+) Transcript_24210:1814-2785(+)
MVPEAKHVLLGLGRKRRRLRGRLKVQEATAALWPREWREGFGRTGMAHKVQNLVWRDGPTPSLEERGEQLAHVFAADGVRPVVQGFDEAQGLESLYELVGRDFAVAVLVGLVQRLADGRVVARAAAPLREVLHGPPQGEQLGVQNHSCLEGRGMFVRFRLADRGDDAHVVDFGFAPVSRFQRGGGGASRKLDSSRRSRRCKELLQRLCRGSVREQAPRRPGRVAPCKGAQETVRVHARVLQGIPQADDKGVRRRHHVRFAKHLDVAVADAAVAVGVTRCCPSLALDLVHVPVKLARIPQQKLRKRRSRRRHHPREAVLVQGGG